MPASWVYVTASNSADDWIDPDDDWNDIALLASLEYHETETDKIENWILKMRGMDSIKAYKGIRGPRSIKSGKTKYYSELHKIRRMMK